MLRLNFHALTEAEEADIRNAFARLKQSILSDHGSMDAHSRRSDPRPAHLTAVARVLLLAWARGHLDVGALARLVDEVPDPEDFAPTEREALERAAKTLERNRTEAWETLRDVRRVLARQPEGD